MSAFRMTPAAIEVTPVFEINTSPVTVTAVTTLATEPTRMSAEFKVASLEKAIAAAESIFAFVTSAYFTPRATTESATRTNSFVPTGILLSVLSYPQMSPFVVSGLVIPVAALIVMSFALLSTVTLVPPIIDLRLNVFAGVSSLKMVAPAPTFAIMIKSRAF